MIARSRCQRTKELSAWQSPFWCGESVHVRDWAAGLALTAVVGGGAWLAAPRGNDPQIRAWYQQQESRIPQLDAELRARHRPAAERARAAYDLRHQARLRARALMRAEGRAIEAAALETRDLEKYGNKDGPTFEWLVAEAMKKANKSAPDDSTYESIIQSAQQTNSLVDRWNAIWR